MKKILNSRLLVLILLASASFQINAQTGLGVGASKGQSPYQGVSDNPNTIPAFISYEGKKGYFRGIEAGYYIWQQGDRSNRLSLSLLASGRMEGYHSSDSRYLRGMDERTWSLDGGLGLSWRQGKHHYSLKAVTDLLGKHEGQEITAAYSYWIPLTQRLSLMPTAQVNWLSGNLLDYYYGVQDKEVDLALGRTAYRAGADLQYSAGFNLMWQPAERFSVLLMARTRWLSDSATDSPLVDRDTISGVMAAVIFRL